MFSDNKLLVLPIVFYSPYGNVLVIADGSQINTMDDWSQNSKNLFVRLLEKVFVRTATGVCFIHEIQLSELLNCK